MGLKLMAMGRCLPKRVVTNQDLAQMVDTSDEWIISRTGIETRRFAAEGESNVFLATEAAREAITRAGISQEDIAFCVVATVSPDRLMPAQSCSVAGELGLPNSIVCFDLNAACSGFIYALTAVHGLLAHAKNKYGLVIGSEVLSRIMDMTDRNTCVLFGDGAGAAVVQYSDEHPFHFVGGSDPNPTALACELRNPAIQMDGKAVFRFAIETAPRCVNQLLEESGLQLDDIDTVICHQANKRIIDSVIRRLGGDEDRFLINLHRYGNTSSASIPLALYELEAKAGSRVLCVGFGGGLTYGAVLLTL